MAWFVYRGCFGYNVVSWWAPASVLMGTSSAEPAPVGPRVALTEGAKPGSERSYLPAPSSEYRHGARTQCEH